VSNLTNLILAGTFRVPFADFVARMLPIQVGVLVVTYAGLRWHFDAELRTFDAARVEGDPASAIPHRGYFRATVVVLVMALIGYLTSPLAGVEPYAVAFAACAVLAVTGVRAGRVDRGLVREVSWGVVPFVIGLFVVVQGLAGLGLANAAGRLLARTPTGSIAQTLVATGAAAVASNVVNNLPATLVARSALVQFAHLTLGQPSAATSLVYATLVGTNVGPNLVPFGSLATVLVLTIARERGVRVSGWAFARAGLWVTPLACLLASVALALLGRGRSG
jgi:arsenical pump membrane protein